MFWLLSGMFLTGWFLFWNTKNQGFDSTAKNVLAILPIADAQKKDYQALVEIGQYLLNKDDQEKTFLILFQNNLEIRPGGGFLGAFGIVKIKNGRVVSLETHDLSNFEARVTANEKAPYPLPEIMKTKFWKMRDANWSPDFAINARKVQEFYQRGGGQEQFDGVIGITSNVLISILKIVGPIEVEGYPGTYDSGNAILALEYQVEKAFDEQGIERENRKTIMADLAKVIEQKIFALSLGQKIQLSKTLLTDLSEKDIQLYFANEKLQEVALKADWTGTMNQTWSCDYLMSVDANLGAFKSDYYIKRTADYFVDLSGSGKKPFARLKITYKHTAKQKDWMTKDYLTYLRVYVPQDSWLTYSNIEGAQFGQENGRKYFGFLVKVPLDSSKTVELSYTLPEYVKNNYRLLIEKQAGISDVPLTVHLVGTNGQQEDFSYIMNEDVILNGNDK